MSRNLGMTSCDRCGRESVVVDEAKRFITKEEAGRYYSEFAMMLVANATCPRCQAQYLAWIDDPGGYSDLSYRSTFNDEPGAEDIPTPRILKRLERFRGIAAMDDDQRLGLADGLLIDCHELLKELLGG